VSRVEEISCRNETKKIKLSAKNLIDSVLGLGTEQERRGENTGRMRERRELGMIYRNVRTIELSISIFFRYTVNPAGTIWPCSTSYNI
jgi:hypothetical protein